MPKFSRISLLMALAALALKKPLGGDEAIRGSAQKTLVFGLAVILLMQAGRALCAVLTGSAPLSRLCCLSASSP